jgi:hypothetical protein
MTYLIKEPDEETTVHINVPRHRLPDWTCEAQVFVYNEHGWGQWVQGKPEAVHTQ